MSDFQIVNKNGEVDLISPRPKSSKKTLKTSPSSAQLTPPSSEKPSLPPAPSGSLRRSTSTSASLGQKLRSSSFNASTAPAPSPAATKSLRSSSPSSKPIVKKKKVTVKLAESSSSSASSSSSLSSRNESDLEYDPETFNKSSTPPTKIETKPKEENNKLHQALTSATSVPVLSVDFQVSSSSPSSPPEKSNASAGAISESTSPRLAIGSPPRSSSLISPRALSPSSSTSEIKSSSSSSPPSFTSAKRSTSPLATLPPVLPSILPAESTSSSSPGQNGSESSSSVHEGGELSPTSSKLNAEEAARRREKIKSLGAKKANLMDFVIDDSVPRSPRKTDSDSILTNSKRKLSSSANLLNYGSLGNLPSSSSSSSSSASSSPTSEGKTPRKRHHKSGLKEEESLLSSSPSSSNLASMGPSSPPVAESLKEALADPNIKWGRSAETQMIIDMLKSEALRINNPTPTTNTIEVQRKEEVPDVSLLSSSYSMSSLSELSSSGEDNLRRSEKRRSSQHRRSVILKMKKNKDFVITRNEDSFDNASTPALELSGTPRRGSDNAVIVDRRSQIAEEILSTEKHYVHTLDVMMEKYQKPILEELKNNDTLDVNKVEVRQIFGNLNTILNVNNQLLRDLTTRMENWNEEETCLGDLFLDFAPYFRMYNQYANQYDEAQTILSHNLKKPNFNDLLLRLDETTDLAPRLEGLLIAPIQRIPRYLLLLTDMLRHTPETHKDYELLNQAIPLMQSVADYINREIKQAANMKKFMELSSQGAKALLKPHRLLIYDGLLTDDKKNKFHFWLFNDIFVHVPEKKAIKKSNLEKPQYQWPLHLVWVRFDTKKETMEVLGPSAMYKMKPTNEESALWRLHFAKALTDHFEFLKTTHDRELQKEKEVEMSMSNAQRFGSYDFPSGAHYSGWWLNGKMEGHGYWTFNGTYYNGSFVANEKHGVGEMTYFGSETYTGTFEHDRPHGKGVLRYPNGDVYDGEWKNGRKSGTGVLTCVSGDTYEGNWSDDQPEGMGKMRYSNGAVYKGNWQNGLRQGYGVLKIKDYMRYEGMWSAGLRNGKGISSYIDGSQYVGSWREGLREGNGMYSSVHGKYEGDWLEDAMEGKGRFEFVNGNVYEGFWKRNLFNGQGKLIFASGIYKQYEGEWINGKKNGTGVLLFTNGDKFEGTFKDDQMHGNGEYVYANTSKITDRWVKGQLDGKCTARGALAIHTKVNGIAKDNVITSSDSTILGFHSFPTIQFGTDW